MEVVTLRQACPPGAGTTSYLWRTVQSKHLYPHGCGSGSVSGASSVPEALQHGASPSEHGVLHSGVRVQWGGDCYRPDSLGVRAGRLLPTPGKENQVGTRNSLGTHVFCLDFGGCLNWHICKPVSMMFILLLRVSGISKDQNDVPFEYGTKHSVRGRKFLRSDSLSKPAVSPSTSRSSRHDCPVIWTAITAD
jgi:hypothetical protein